MTIMDGPTAQETHAKGTNGIKQELYKRKYKGTRFISNPNRIIASKVSIDNSYIELRVPASTVNGLDFLKSRTSNLHMFVLLDDHRNVQMCDEHLDLLQLLLQLITK